MGRIVLPAIAATTGRELRRPITCTTHAANTSSAADATRSADSTYAASTTNTTSTAYTTSAAPRGQL
jgi:hypothetical protein